MIVDRVWADQPGTYFCIAAKHIEKDEWREEWFIRKQFPLVGRLTQELADDGYCVYWCPHGFNKKRRLARYAEMPKLMWADLDEIDPRGLDELRPSIAWESSPGRFQCLWRLEEELDEDTTNQKLTYFLGADRGGWDLTQVLRVPGTINNKYAGKPRVKMMWQDGYSFTLEGIKGLLPKEKKKPVDKDNAKAIFKKYRKFLSPWARREIMNGKPRRGKRSEVFWKLVNEMIEAGADEDEAFTILWASPWNKFRERRGGDTQLQREIEKVYTNKLNTLDPQAEYEAESELPDDDVPEMDEDELYGSFLGIVKPENPRWVVYPYIARGHITSIEGDPEVGKSWFALALASSISEGRKRFPVDHWSDENQHGAVFYFDAENDTGNVAQRMVDSNMFTQVDNPHDQAPFFHIGGARLDFREDDAIDDVRDRIAAIKKLFKNNHQHELGTALIIFDTFINFAGDTDTNKQSDVMNALAHMKILAKEEDCGIAIIRHYGKTQHQNQMHRGMGSTQFAATCRCMVGVHRHPDDPDVRVVTLSKSSLATKSDLRALSYRLEPVFPGTNDIKKRDRTRMIWSDWIDLTAYDIVASSGEISKKEKEVRDERNKMKEVVDKIFENKRGVEAEVIKNQLERESIPLKDFTRNMIRAGYKPVGRGVKLRFKRIR